MIAFHGTSKEKKEIILNEKHFIPSTRENEWAGSGVYFFYDDNPDDSKLNAMKWARCIKEYKNPETILVLIDLPDASDFFLDLTDIETRKMFHKFRENYFCQLSKRCSDNNTNNSVSKDSRIFDCAVINALCKLKGIKLVKRDVYINFSKNRFNYGTYKCSSIPNCVILCLRDESLIKEWGN